MSNVARRVRDGYEGICGSATPEDAVKRYADYHREMMALPPMEPGQLMEAVDPTSSLNIDGIWKAMTRVGGAEVPYLRGSGMVGVGIVYRGKVRDGRIVAMSAGPLTGTEHDLVRGKYPNCYNYVPMFLGASAMMAVLLDDEGELGHEAYVRYGEILRSEGILGPDRVPHLGPSFHGVDSESAFTAGASGVLAHPHVHAEFAARLESELAADREEGLLEWEHDAAAGHHDVVANRLAFRSVRGLVVPAIDVVAEVEQAKARRLLGQDFN